MDNYFSDAQVMDIAKRAGFNAELLTDRFKSLMNLAVSTAIGEPDRTHSMMVMIKAKGS